MQEMLGTGGLGGWDPPTGSRGCTGPGGGRLKAPPGSESGFEASQAASPSSEEAVSDA